MKGNCNLLIAKIPFELHFMVIGDIQFTKRNGDILRYCTIHTFSSTFLVFKLNRICKWRWSTIGVNIFVQFSFSGVYLFAGTGICRNSDFTPLSNKRNRICYTSVQIWYLAWTYSRNLASIVTNARPQSKFFTICRDSARAPSAFLKFGTTKCHEKRRRMLERISFYQVTRIIHGFSRCTVSHYWFLLWYFRFYQQQMSCVLGTRSLLICNKATELIWLYTLKLQT